MRYRPLLLAALVPMALATPSWAAPTCYSPVPDPACGGRVVAEPERSTTFHQFNGPVESAERSLRAMEALAPDFLEVKPLAEWTGDPAHQSFGGLPIWVVRVTDENAPREDKKQVAASLSVHGLESAGREGGLRYVEDLARWAKDDPQRLMYSGDNAVPFAEVMRTTETWIAFTNSDGWAAGDADSTTGPGFERANANGKDLNRDFATVGWFNRGGGRGLAESEPEIAGWTALVRTFPNLSTSTDIHGELTTPNDAFSDLIIPAGQWSPKQQDQVNQFGLNMIKTVERKFEEDGVVLDEVFASLPNDGTTPRQPANVAASYDIVGYDDSGFMGDWFTQRGSVHMDVENFLSNLAPNNAYVQGVEQAHVAAVRGNLEATIVEALFTDSVAASADYGRIAYIDDPVRTKSDPAYTADGIPGTGSDVVEGETQVPYDVSRLDYYPVLRDAFGADIEPVAADALPTTDLSVFDTLVVTDMDALPAGSTLSKEQYVAALDGFAKGGGQLLLTDRAVRLAADLGAVPSESLTVNRTDAGHVDFDGELGDHPYEQGLVGKPSQTYYEVMLGYPSRNSSPNYGVERGAWEAAGGTTVATVGDQGSSDSPNTALGNMAWGEGRLTIFGAILPQAIERLVVEDGTQTETPHPYGLADFAVTITGGQVLDNVFAFRGVERTPVVAAPGPQQPGEPAQPTDPTTPEGSEPGSPAQPGEPGTPRARSLNEACPEGRVPGGSRQDVDGNTHERAIDCMIWWEIANGTTSTTYSPVPDVTREHMAAFITRLIEKSGKELPTGPDAFDDDNGRPYEASINKLAQAGIIDGRSGRTFDPLGSVRRGQMAKFLVNAYELRSDKALDGSVDYFDDDDGDLFEPFINKSAAGGFTEGRAGRYELSASVRRDAMAAFLARSLDLLVAEGTTSPKQ